MEARFDCEHGKTRGGKQSPRGGFGHGGGGRCDRHEAIALVCPGFHDPVAARIVRAPATGRLKATRATAAMAPASARSGLPATASAAEPACITVTTAGAP